MIKSGLRNRTPAHSSLGSKGGKHQWDWLAVWNPLWERSVAGDRAEGDLQKGREYRSDQGLCGKKKEKGNWGKSRAIGGREHSALPQEAAIIQPSS